MRNIDGFCFLVNKFMSSIKVIVLCEFGSDQNSNATGRGPETTLLPVFYFEGRVVVLCFFSYNTKCKTDQRDGVSESIQTIIPHNVRIKRF